VRVPRLAIIGNPDSIHVSRWCHHFAEHGFDVVVLTYYPSSLANEEHLQARSLRARRGGGGGSGADPAGGSPVRGRLVALMPGAMRLVSAVRFRLAGLQQQLREARPDIVHGHYLSDYGFLAATGGVRPLVTTAWGSDVLRDTKESAITNGITRWVIHESALVTYNADVLGRACAGLGARKDQLLKVVLGVDSLFLDGPATPQAKRPPVIVSHRNLDRTIFNVDVIINAMPAVLRSVPDALLLVGNSGRLEPGLRELAARLGLGAQVRFIGHAKDQRELAERLAGAAVYVAVPDSDGSSVTLLEAMASGSFPVVSDIPSNREWVAPDGGLLVPPRDSSALAEALIQALEDPSRRQQAAERNRAFIAEHGAWDRNMARMERAYRELLVG
jgi:glycosyltransferase involved in cell wall biosynthesis